MVQLKGILFIDIETVPIAPEYALLADSMRFEWDRKAKFMKNITDGLPDPAALFEERAGIFSEFAKVVCIGFGSFHDDSGRMRLKSLVNEDEKVLLTDFCEVLTKFSAHYKELRFCGHNIKEFDIPFLCRRMIINNMGLPTCMDVGGKKPWEVSHIDTMDLWKFGDYKNFTSLSLLATVLGIPSPKTDMDGSQVAGAYWHDKDLERIGNYCLQDVLTSARVYLRLKGVHGVHVEPEYV